MMLNRKKRSVVLLAVLLTIAGWYWCRPNQPRLILGGERVGIEEIVSVSQATHGDEVDETKLQVLDDTNEGDVEISSHLKEQHGEPVMKKEVELEMTIHTDKNWKYELWRAYKGETNWSVPMSREPRALKEFVRKVKMDIEKFAKDAIKRLQSAQIDCIPKRCVDPATFNNRGNVTKLYLDSFPGSGNTFLRSILRSGTGLFTGSTFDDKKLAAGGFEGELLPPFDPKTLFVKTHYPYILSQVATTPIFPEEWADGGIFLLRSPLDAIQAECVRKKTHDHMGQVSLEDLDRIVTHRWKRMTRAWTKMMRLWNNDAKDISSDTLLQFRLNSPMKDRKAGFPVATIFYEDFVTDFQRTLVYLFAFIKAWYGDTVISSVSDAVVCAVHNTKTIEKFHRQHSEIKSVYESRNTTAICRKFQRFWNHHKWGRCDGKLQHQRTDRIFADPLIKSIPSHICNQ